MDFSGALAAVDAAQLESLITSVQQAPLSIETFLPQTDTDLVLMGFSVSEVLYP